jgi:hypothetical protein
MIASARHCYESLSCRLAASEYHSLFSISVNAAIMQFRQREHA